MTARTRIAIVATIACTSLGALAVHSVRLDRQRHEERASLAAQEAARRLASHVDDIFDKADLALRSVSLRIAEQLSHGRIDRARLDAHVAQLQASVPELENLRVLDHQGDVSFERTTRREGQSDLADRVPFGRLRDDPGAGLVILGPGVGHVTGKWGVTLARRVDAPDGRFAGAVALFLPGDSLARKLPVPDLGPDGEFAIVSRDLQLLHRQPRHPGDEKLLGRTLDSPDFTAALAADPAGAAVRHLTGLDGVERSTYFERSARYPFYVVAGLAADDYLADWRRYAFVVGGAATAAALAIAVASFGIRRGSNRLRESETRWKFALESASQGVWDWNLVEGRASYSSIYQKVLGYDGDVISDSIVEWSGRVHPDDLGDARAALNGYLRGESQSFACEYRMRRRDGSYAWVESHGMIVEHTAGGKPARMVGTITDVTARREAQAALADSERLLRERATRICSLEKELARRAVEAGAAVRAKDAFLRNVGHEFRTPMNQIIGGVDLVLYRCSDPESERWLRLVRASARTLLGVVNKALDVAAIEAGLLELDDENFSIAAVVDEACRAAEGRAAARRLVLVSQVAPGVPLLVRGDRARVSQTLLDLVDNAIGFTGSGTVAVSARVEAPRAAADDPRTLVRFEVRDTGVGIDADTARLIFGAFSQGDDSTARRHGGLGVSLYRARALARLMDGDAGFDSAPGAGSTFWFTARFQPAPSAAMPWPDAGSSASNGARAEFGALADLAALPCHAAPFQPAAPRSPALAPQANIDASTLRELLDELESMISGDDLGAVSKLDEAAPLLAAAANDEDVERLRAEVGQFDFAAALATFGRIRSATRAAA